jgi:hypothetical protein
MSSRIPGPVCSTRVGDDWIDGGTLCRSLSGTPGPTAVAGAAGGALAFVARQPFKAQFDRDHVYSRAPEAARKRDIDLQIIGDDYRRSAEISLDNENYLKELIRLGSGGKQAVGAHAKKLQFFIIRGGAEGLLPADMAAKDASNVVVPGTTTDGGTPREFRFDNNDLLAVFDAGGKLIGAALLQRPVSITGVWREDKANAVYNAWHNKGVSIYRNANFSVPYLGLFVDDGMKGTGWVDMHKEEATNGCIFITDPDTPGLDTEELKTFEPKLIVAILASIGKRPDQVKAAIPLGTMRVVDIK